MHACDFETDEAVEDFFDGIIEHRAAERFVEDRSRFVDEDVEGVVHCAGGSVDPAEDIFVDIAVRVRDGAVGARGPACRGIVEAVDDFAGEVADFRGELGDFFLDGAEEDELEEAG